MDPLETYLKELRDIRSTGAAVWEYTLGGYQVLKKWLSYREQTLLGRPFLAEDSRHFTDTSRRIGALLLLRPELDENYQRVKEAVHPWGKRQGNGE